MKFENCGNDVEKNLKVIDKIISTKTKKTKWVQKPTMLTLIIRTIAKN